MERLAAFIRHLQERRGRYRAPVLAAMLALFITGAAVSYRQLGIDARDLRLVPLAQLVTLIVPSLVYGGIGLMLLARSHGLKLRLPEATITSAYAYLAELLPIPGGAIVRATALVRIGGNVRDSSLLVILTAILWISLAMIGVGLALLSEGTLIALPIAAIGTALTMAITTWLWRKAGATVAGLTLVHRVAGIALNALRLHFAFAVFGVPIGVSQTLPFVLALLLGSASSIAPAGLGVSETLAALAAASSHYPPSTAFLAVGMDRVLCLTGCAIVALLGQISAAKPAARVPGEI